MSSNVNVWLQACPSKPSEHPQVFSRNRLIVSFSEVSVSVGSIGTFTGSAVSISSQSLSSLSLSENVLSVGSRLLAELQNMNSSPGIHHLPQIQTEYQVPTLY